MSSPRNASLADRLIAAHRNSSIAADAAAPVDFAAAMVDQANVAEALGAEIAGWKVAIHPEFGAIAAPLLSSALQANPAALAFIDGVLVEVEIAVKLGRDLPASDYQRRDIVAAIDRMCVGVELLKSRLSPELRTSFLAFLSDNLGNAGYVAGAALPWTDPDLAALRCRLSIDDDVLHEAPCVHAQGDVLAPIIAWLARGDRSMGGLKAGQIITTGSLCGGIPLPRRGRLRAAVERIGEIEIDFN